MQNWLYVYLIVLLLGDIFVTYRTVRLLRFWATVCKTVRPVLSDRCLPARHVCLSVTLVYCGPTVGWIMMKVGRKVGLGPGDIVLDGDPASLSKKGHITPHFFAHVYCGQTARLIKMPLGMEVWLGPGHIVLDGDPAPSQRVRMISALGSRYLVFSGSYVHNYTEYNLNNCLF